MAHPGEAAQHDVFRTAEGTLVVILQSDLLAPMRTRVVAPLLPADRSGRPMPPLTPEIEIEGAAYLLMPQLAATLTLAELGDRVGTAAHRRDEITRAVDALLGGI